MLQQPRQVAFRWQMNRSSRYSWVYAIVLYLKLKVSSMANGWEPPLPSQSPVCGQAVEILGNAEFQSDPANGQELGKVPEMGVTETKRAIEAASQAFRIWSLTSPKVSAFCN